MFILPFLSWLFSLLPYPMLAQLGEALGVVAYHLGKKRRHICVVNLRLCFPQKSAAEIDALTRAHFRYAARSMLEQSIFWWSRRSYLIQKMQIDLSAVRAANNVHEQRPIIFWIPHFVCLLVASYGLALNLGLPVVNVYQRQRQPWFDRFVARRRSRFGTFLVARDEGPRPILQHIKAHHAVTLSADMDFGIRGAVFAPFFDNPAATVTGPIRMARQTGAVVVPVIAAYLPAYQGWKVELLTPLDLGADDEPELVTATRLNRELEQWIHTRPEQYLWTHRRFKTRPEGQASLYD